MSFCVIHPRATTQVLRLLFCVISLKIILLKIVAISPRGQWVKPEHACQSVYHQLLWQNLHVAKSRTDIWHLQLGCAHYDRETGLSCNNGGFSCAQIGWIALSLTFENNKSKVGQIVRFFNSWKCSWTYLCWVRIQAETSLYVCVCVLWKNYSLLCMNLFIYIFTIYMPHNYVKSLLMLWQLTYPAPGSEPNQLITHHLTSSPYKRKPSTLNWPNSHTKPQQKYSNSSLLCLPQKTHNHHGSVSIQRPSFQLFIFP